MTHQKAAEILQAHNDWRRGIIDEYPYQSGAAREVIEFYNDGNPVLESYTEYLRGHGRFEYDVYTLGREIDELIGRIKGMEL